MIIDEAAQGTELDSIIPMVNFSVKNICLFGDHQQLSPIVRSPFGQSQRYERSLFERFYHECSPPINDELLSEDEDLSPESVAKPILLDTQYRMHPEIASFPSEYVYAGRLPTVWRDKRIGAASRLATSYAFFDVCKGQESPSSVFPGSWRNTIEVDVVKRVVEDVILLASG